MRSHGARRLLIVFGVSALALIAAAGSAAGPAPRNVSCTDAFSGIAFDVTVAADNGCDLSGATVEHDLVVGDGSDAYAEGLRVGHDVLLPINASLELGGATVGHDVTSGPGSSIHLERTTIEHDLLALAPTTVQTGKIDPDSPGGPVTVGDDVKISGAPPDEAFDGICDLTVGHDFRMTDRTETLGLGLGDNCPRNGRPGNTIGHDLVVTRSAAVVGFFGPSALEVGHNDVGHDLIFTDNTAVLGGYLEVADNVVAHDAICRSNDPAPSHDAEDGPNVVGHRDTCD